MSLIALPTASAKSRWTIWLAAGLVALVGVAAVWALSTRVSPAASTGFGAFHRIVPTDMDVKINKDGELQAINNIEIQSEVEGQTTVQTLVKEGTSVKKGDILITLDSSSIRQKIEDTYLEVQKAEADLTNAREMREIQISTNNANLEAAEVALTLAELALKQYVDGTYPQALTNAQTEVKMAGINLRNQEDKLGQTKALFAKGFVTATQIKDDELLVTNAKNNLAKAETALKVLTEYTHEMELADKQNAVSQAEQRVARVKRENAASLSQKDADVRAKEQALLVLKRRMERLEQQLAACTISAPAEGLVVYATSGDRNAQSSLQEGMQVRERQALMRLPDTSSMKAVVRISEAQVGRLREGHRATVHLSSLKDPIGATVTKISVLADSSQRFWGNPDVKEYPVDLSLDYTPPSLKPGMGAQTTIFVDRLHSVLTVPLTAIYSVGQQAWVFERRDNGNHKPMPVKIGATNETHAQVLEGVTAGMNVKLLEVGEGQVLLDRAGIKVEPPPATQPDDSTRGPSGRPRGEGMDVLPNEQTRPDGMPRNLNGSAPAENGQPGMEGGRFPRGDRPPGQGGRRRTRPQTGDVPSNPDAPRGDNPGSATPG